MRQRNQNQRGNCEDGDELNTSDVEEVGLAADEHARPLTERRMVTGARSKLRETLVDEIVADMDAPELNARVVGGVLCAFAGKIERRLSHLRFGVIGVKGDERNALSIELAALEIHRRIGLRWIVAQCGIEEDERLNEELPVGVADGAQALETSQNRRR